MRARCAATLLPFRFSKIAGVLLALVLTAAIARATGEPNAHRLSPPDKNDLVRFGDHEFALTPFSRILLRDFKQDVSANEPSVLIVGEPHQLIGGQEDTYLAITEFITSNHIPAEELVFLRESLEVGKQLDLAPLLREEAVPDWDDVRLVLSSYLIPADVAISWEYAGKIPIYGMEDPQLFRASMRVATMDRPEDEDWTSFICRNSIMADEIAKKAREGRYVVVFVGNGHILGTDAEVGPFLMRESNVFNYMGERRATASEDKTRCEFGYLTQQLKKRGIGYTYIAAFDQAAYFNDEARGENDQYLKLMIAQLRGDVQSYLKALEPSTLGRVTVSPDPRAAADFLSKAHEDGDAGSQHESGDQPGGKESESERGGSPGPGWGKIAGIVREALRGRAGGRIGNFGIVGPVTREEADKIARSFVGDDGVPSSDGTATLSRDLLRQIRIAVKRYSKGKLVMNLQSRIKNTGRWLSNGHLIIEP